ncbi:hypothetical protein QP975_09380, partial [Corynebacterium mastitidis]|nr:hypothetical protein [Corynebacterium mastitidis]
MIAEHKDIKDEKQTVTSEDASKVLPKPKRPQEGVSPSSQDDKDQVNPEDESSDESMPSSEKPVPEPSSQAPVETQEPTASV